MLSVGIRLVLEDFPEGWAACPCSPLHAPRVKGGEMGTKKTQQKWKCNGFQCLTERMRFRK